MEDWLASYTQGRQAGETVGGVLYAWSERCPGLCFFSYPLTLEQSLIPLLPNF